MNCCHGFIINMDYLCLILLGLRRVAIARDNQNSAQKCYRHSTKDLEKIYMSVNLLEQLESYTKAEPVDPLKKSSVL